jgi:hypothetical protein
MTHNGFRMKKSDAEPEKHKVPEDVDVPIPPDGGYGWVVLIAGFVS